ncbi:serine/threonine-protein phosphatase 4 regulatory subunit 4-like isoform X4 [Amphibalanus amphitrite]|uniref:serine/threonine-protein phosphatase 4 regulatory subunit 4-like isoform X4 n=1 Tax=Amphibalanus amphitrite TaxID=1232801 RepID=UPI001C8FD659|nr:serine/threonine-protein phosphatase 4 regulatory subunit 4-like isoform X4 [Amphibalanus amphitrite]XP_043236205.1 serine/threonine-protein phosphatase 4 regulatory subunit 4-like isoform X4 [Amphibalanus amphitrite]XP_043236206.1 serine/threonine-protein phosphatase 4 regulatory subunit 4-like isoform X4 [Amphibalanus amphitrite]
MPLPLQLRVGLDGQSLPAAEGGEALCDVPDGAGDAGQRAAVAEGVPRLLGSDPAGCLSEVVPRVTAALPSSPPDFQRAASASFLAVLRRELLPQSTFTQTFLQSILISVDSNDPVVAAAWLETLLDVIDLLPADVIQQEILSVAVEKSQLSHPVASRVAGCKLIGRMATKFDPYTIQTELLASVQSLCQDVDSEVRAAMCSQLGAVAHGLGPQETRAAIIPELVELSSDEEVAVRLAAFRTLVDMLDILDAETCTQTIIPLSMKVCESSYESRDSSLPVIAKLLGKLSCGLSEYLSPEQKQTFLDFYGGVARLKNLHKAAAARNEFNPMPDLVPQLDPSERYMQCCEACAFNFPAMLLLAGGDLSRSNLHATFTDLVFDPHPGVRRVIAAGFHEVCRLLGPSVHQVHSELVHLLKDDSVDVLAALVERLPLTLEAFVRHGVLGPKAKPELVAELTAALMTCECVISNTTRWRLHAGLLERLSSLADCFPPDHLYHCWVPTVFQKLHTVRPIPCRQAAARTLLVFLQNVRHIEHRHMICGRLVEELGQSDSCHMRKLYLDICSMVLDMFSKNFFKQYFFMTTLTLVDDPVPNIRRGLCLLLARMKATLRLPSDKRRLQQLEAVVRQLLVTEQDRDAAAAVRHAIIQLDKIEVAMDTPTRPALLLEADAEDRRRQKQEQQLLEPPPPAAAAASSPAAGGRPVDERRLSRGGRIPVRTGQTPPAPAGGAASPATSRTKARGSGPAAAAGTTPRYRTPGSQRPAPGSRRLSLVESSECRIPSLARLRVRDAVSEPELPPPPSSSPRGRLNHAASLENLDPTADEFYVDAGIRISASDLRQLERPDSAPGELPPPPETIPSPPPGQGAGRTPTRRLRPPSTYGRYCSGGEASGSRTAAAETSPHTAPPSPSAAELAARCRSEESLPAGGGRRTPARRPASAYSPSGVSSTQSSPGCSRTSSPDGRASPAFSRIPLRSSFGAGKTSSLPSALTRARRRKK